MDQKPNGGKNDNNGGNKSPFTRLNVVMLVCAALVLTMLANTAVNMRATVNRTQIKYSQFFALVENGYADYVNITSDKAEFKLKSGVDRGKVIALLTDKEDENAAINRLLEYPDELFNDKRVFYSGLIYDEALVPLLREKRVEFGTPVQTSNPIMDFMISWVLPIALFYAATMLIMNMVTKRMTGDGGFLGMMGRSNAKMFNVDKKTGVSFSDFAGSDEAKESLVEIVDFLHNPQKYQAIGAKQPKGALLVGPPGTGKTLLAKAVAGEAKVPFFSLSGSEFVEMYVGVGASRVRDLFKQATKQAPCIIFIDEIDTIGRSRDGAVNSNDEREQTLNQLLSEMDGFDSSKGIIILGATNRPDILDKALLRPGRFDRRVIVEKPDLPGREAILDVHAKKVKTAESINLRQIALATPGASGADLANMINEGALRAVRCGRDKVEQEDLMESVEVVIAGKEKKDRLLSAAEKRRVAFHEVGHALSAALQKDTKPVQKITIVPRTMGTLGYVMHTEESEKYIETKDEIVAEIVSLMAGRAAEELEFGSISTGAQNDIERATKMARAMVTQYGMSDKFGMVSLESTESRYLDGRAVLTCSERTGADIDVEVMRILEDCHKRAVELLGGNRKALSDIAAFLIEKESITGDVFMDVLNKIRDNQDDNQNDNKDINKDVDNEETV